MNESLKNTKFLLQISPAHIMQGRFKNYLNILYAADAPIPPF